VDADKRCVKYLELVGPNLWKNERASPDLRSQGGAATPLQAIAFDTNAPPTFVPDPALAEFIRQLDQTMDLDTNLIKRSAPRTKPANPYE
jgi:hypothetical protein